MEISDLRRAIKSINEGLCTREEFLNNDVYSHGPRYYSHEDYRYTRNGDLIPYDEAGWCSHYEEYFHNEDIRLVQVGRCSETWSIQAIQNTGDIINFQGDYYDDDAAEREGIVWVEDIGEYGYADDNYYDDDCCSYYSTPREVYTRGYHDGSYKFQAFGGETPFTIGFEIEKEDNCIKESIEIDDFESETDHLWRKERDGSLDSDSGFELISPAFEFNIERIFEHIEENDELVKHINAKYSTSCGGHIHLSHKNLSGNLMFDMVCGYTPLLYSLYHGRVDKNYSKGKSNQDLKDQNEKYQAIKIWRDRVEFRIISAVPNVKTLKWRSRLIELITKYPTNDVRKAYYYIHTQFKDLLSEVYGDDDRIGELFDRIKMNTMKFESIDLNLTKRQETIKRNKLEKDRLESIKRFELEQAEKMKRINEELMEMTSSLTSAC